ncbi:hypothetical protein [Amycolatopsis sp. PS_44_ISF1]|uniref:hypothetical protein n=1 Tax=Amycolatopsis sp. PS_44_ISF1 TaxID=2974917 RepID=UPI0028E0684C|nr:hypothetical protein [Amycolatopsis sp. PS_44_ISF1]MDT8915071.1 hypothetical protein [Amycolatopsis sp. PS_44_ISF1]
MAAVVVTVVAVAAVVVIAVVVTVVVVIAVVVTVVVVIAVVMTALSGAPAACPGHLGRSVRLPRRDLLSREAG